MYLYLVMVVEFTLDVQVSLKSDLALSGSSRVA